MIRNEIDISLEVVLNVFECRTVLLVPLKSLMSQ